MTEPTLQDRYTHLKSNAEAFVQSMKVMVAAAENSGDDDLASKLRTWCLSPWEAALRDDASGDLWFICETCGNPIKNETEQVSSEDGCWFHQACADGSWPPFNVGDRVTHAGRQECGTVTGVEDGCVVVEFDNPTSRGYKSIGKYDAAWFRMYPRGLIAAASEGEERR